MTNTAMPPEMQALVFGLAAATVIAILLLVFGERPALAAAVRALIGGAPAEDWRDDPADGPDDDAGVMSNAADEPAEHAPVAAAGAPAATVAQSGRNPIAASSSERNALLFAQQADDLAAMVLAGKVTETDGIQIIFGVRPSSTNQTYLLARELLHARLDRARAPRPGTPRPLTEAQQAVRAELGLTVLPTVAQRDEDA